MNVGYQFGLILFALFCVLLNGFFVAAEFAIVRIRLTRLEELKKSGNPLAKMALRITSRIDEYLSGTQLGITITSLALGWVGEPAFADLLRPFFARLGLWSEVAVHSISLALAFVLITFLHIVIGELAPKSLAIQKTEQTMLWLALPIRVFHLLMYPFITVFNTMANFVIRAVGLRPASEVELAHSEEELRLILAHSQKVGVIASEERDMLERVFDFGDRNVHQIMVPRSDIVYLSTHWTLQENLEIARQNEHSRYPLCAGDLDHVHGMVHLKDLLWRLGNADEAFNLELLKRDVLFVPATQPIRVLMKEFQRRHVHMAIVVDEYGGTSGLVTLEDVIEELVGEIQDEFDEEAPKYLRYTDGTFLVDGRLLIDEAEKILNTELSDQHNDTVGGHLLSRIGRRPRAGDAVKAGDYEAKVTEVKGFRITKIVFSPLRKGEQFRS